MTDKRFEGNPEKQCTTIFADYSCGKTALDLLHLEVATKDGSISLMIDCKISQCRLKKSRDIVTWLDSSSRCASFLAQSALYSSPITSGHGEVDGALSANIRVTFFIEAAKPCHKHERIVGSRITRSRSLPGRNRRAFEYGQNFRPILLTIVLIYQDKVPQSGSTNPRITIIFYQTLRIRFDRGLK